MLAKPNPSGELGKHHGFGGGGGGQQVLYTALNDDNFYTHIGGLNMKMGE